MASVGAKLVVNYNSDSVQADLVAAEINSTHPETTQQAITVQADVSDESQVQLLFDAAEKELNSQAYILVNSAGIMDDKHPTIANTSVEDFDKTVR